MIIGKYLENYDAEQNVKLSLLNHDLKKFWKRCSSTANYGANYIASSYHAKEEMENNISVILNELLENAVKYSKAHSENINITLFAKDKTILLQVDNVVNEEQYRAFKQYAHDLMNCEDIKSRYLEALESTSKDEIRFGVGLLTILNYFDLTMGFKFQKLDDSDMYVISVQTKIMLEGGK